MPSVTEIVHRRRERRADSRRRSDSRVRAGWLGLGYLFSIALAVGIFAFAFAYADLTRDLPNVAQLPVLLNPTNGLLLQPTRITDRTGGVTLFTFAPSDGPRAYVRLSALPQSLRDATIAAADADFNNHNGYVLSGLDNPDAHPTLAQSLAYDLLLFDEPSSLRRTLRERLLAAQITSDFGRDQILEWYLNSANYGHYAFGIDAAAQLYFGKAVRELTLAESAMLAAVAGAPSLNPFDAPEAAMQRGQELLGVMRDLGLIDEAEYKKAIANWPSPLAPLPITGEGNLAIVNLAMTQLSSRYDRQRIERGGLVIISTIDFDLQGQSLCLTQIFSARLAAQALDENNCASARYLSSLPADANLVAPSASAIVLDPRTGQILALVGETTRGVESPHMSAHPPGSLLAPFIYLTGFARGLGPASLVWDIPQGDIQNADGIFHGPMRLRAALANDYLIPAADVLEQMGAQNAINTARSFGLDLVADSAFVSDSPPASLFDVAAAYSIFAAQGLRNGQTFDDSIQPSIVLRVDTLEGAIWLDWSQPESQSVVTPQLAYLMNHILSDGPARWPSWGNPNVLEIGRPAAVKSGWTGGPDAWTVGYTPSRVVAVWVGDSSTPLNPPHGGEVNPPPQAGGVRAPAALWAALMQTASASLAPDGWSAPAGITEMDVCDPSGLLPTNDCPTIVREIFLNGFEPAQVDNLFRGYQINRETGLLATVFTPAELVERRVFMVVPAEARVWAAESGLPVPPETYDAIQVRAPNPNVNITAPALFADVNGKIQIIGTAAGEGFQYYRIQVGQGLNPREWIQIGGDVRTPAANGLLAEWDTSGLSGLYAIQLIVVYADQRVEIAITQVTVRP